MDPVLRPPSVVGQPVDVLAQFRSLRSSQLYQLGGMMAIDEEVEEEEEEPESSFLSRLQSRLRTHNLRKERRKKRTLASQPRSTPLTAVALPAPDFMGLRGTDSDVAASNPLLARLSPWRPPGSYSPHPSLRLHEELLDLYDFLRETPAEHSARTVVLDRFRDAFQTSRRFASARLDVFGSFACGLMLPGSDLDLQLTLRPGHDFWRIESTNHKRRKRAAEKVLQQARDVLLSCRLIHSEYRIVPGRVPILVCVDRQTLQPVDLSLNMERSSGVPSSLLNVEFVETFADECPAFRVLALALKLFLRERALNEVFHGGLSSFGLSLMLISFLQQHDIVRNESIRHQGHVSLGLLLLDFLALYGIYFNYIDVGIDVKRARYVPKREILKPNEDPLAFRLHILDPNRTGNVVTVGSKKISLVRDAFRLALWTLIQDRENLPSACNCANGGRLSRIIRIDEELLERKQHLEQVGRDTQQVPPPPRHFGEEEESDSDDDLSGSESDAFDSRMEWNDEDDENAPPIIMID